MVCYNDEDISKIKKEFSLFQTNKSKYAEIARLVTIIVNRYSDKPQLYHFAYYGLLRRIKTLERCVENIFNTRDFFDDTIPSDSDLSDILINLQCFVINLYGALENLAWIYAIYINFDGNVHNKSFFDKNKKLLNTLPENIRTLFTKHSEWFSHIKKIRDLLVHQEPFYIPPYCIIDKYKDRFNVLENHKKEAEKKFFDEWFNMYKVKDLSSKIKTIDKIKTKLHKYEKLEQCYNKTILTINNEQSNYMFFKPILAVNTNKEDFLSIQFYPQVLNDTKTLYEKIILLLSYIVSNEK